MDVVEVVEVWKLRISDIYRDPVEVVEVVEVEEVKNSNIHRHPVEVLEVENLKYYMPYMSETRPDPLFFQFLSYPR